jgi:hypothetical protein
LLQWRGALDGVLLAVEQGCRAAALRFYGSFGGRGGFLDSIMAGAVMDGRLM